MARSYKRDSRGRFASGGGGSRATRPSGPASPARGRKQGTKPTRRQGLVTQRRAVASTKRKLAAMDPADQSIKGALSKRAQKAAVTRAKNKLKAAKEKGTVKLPKMAGAVRVGRKKGKGVKAGRKPKQQAAPAKPVKQVKQGGGRSKSGSKQQRAQRILDRLNAIGVNRTGVKAKQAARVWERARRFYLLTSGSGTFESGPRKGQQKTRQEWLKQFGDRVSNPRMARKIASDYRRLIRNAPSETRALSGPRSRARPGQAERGRKRLTRVAQRGRTDAYTPRTTRGANSAAVAERAAAWYQGQRPTPRQSAISTRNRSLAIKTAPVVRMSKQQRQESEAAKRKYGVRSTNPKKPSLKKRLAKSVKRQRKRNDLIQGKASSWSRPRRYQQSAQRIQGNLFTSKPDKVFGKAKKVSSSTKPSRRIRIGTRRQR